MSTDSERLDWLERTAIFPIEIDDFRAPHPCFLTIETPEGPHRFRAVGLRAVIDKAMTMAVEMPVEVKPTITLDHGDRLARDIRAFVAARPDDPIGAVEAAIAPAATAAFWRKAFLDYGTHRMDCPAHPFFYELGSCTCGYVTLLDAIVQTGITPEGGDATNAKRLGQPPDQVEHGGPMTRAEES